VGISPQSFAVKKKNCSTVDTSTVQNSAREDMAGAKFFSPLERLEQRFDDELGTRIGVHVHAVASV
jgi:hypothetical protein